MNSEFKIEKNVPMPPRQVRAMDERFESMDVGDSFAITAARIGPVKSAVYSFHKKNTGRRFALRKVEDLFRCWRTE